MKKTNLLIALCIIAAVCAIIGACKKGDHAPSDIETSDLKQYYQNTLLAKTSSDFASLNPVWGSVYQSKQDKYLVYEVAFDRPDALILPFSRTDLNAVSKTVCLKLLIFKDSSSGKILFSSYMYIENDNGEDFAELHYKDLKKLTGKVIFYHQNGQMANGWIYEDGKPLLQTKGTSEKNYLLMQQKKRGGAAGQRLMDSGDQECNSARVESYFWACVDVGGVKTCGWHSKGTAFITICKPITFSGDETTTDHIAPPDGGGYWPESMDCNGDLNGTAIFTQECGCIGGNTGIAFCLKKVDVDPNVRQCVSNISAIIESNVGNMYNCISDIAGIANVSSAISIGELYSNSIYKIKISEGVINDRYETDNLGNQVTIVTNGTTNSNTGNITLNTNVLNTATDLGVAAVLIHELMHSYFIYGIKNTSGNERFFFQDMNSYLYDNNGLLYSDDYLKSQHEQMAATYVNSMASLLESYAISSGILVSPDKSISLNEYCRDLFWRNLATSQSSIKAPNKNRAEKNGGAELKNESSSSKKKGC